MRRLQILPACSAQVHRCVGQPCRLIAWTVGHAASAGLARKRSGASAGLARHRSGASAGLARHRSGASAGLARHRSGASAGLARRRSGASAGLARHRSSTWHKVQVRGGKARGVTCTHRPGLESQSTSLTKRLGVRDLS